jgi:hypothetical protein
VLNPDIPHVHALPLFIDFTALQHASPEQTTLS